MNSEDYGYFRKLAHAAFPVNNYLVHSASQYLENQSGEF